MDTSRRRSFAEQYRKTQVSIQVSEADPHALIALLLDTACRRIRLAQTCLEQGDIPRKGKAIGDACAMVGYLADVLDVNTGGGLAVNLAGLYAYIMDKLTFANANNDSSRLDEALGLLGIIASAWNAIPVHQRRTTAVH